MRARSEAQQVDLAVVVNGFPRLSETFVLHELLDLERRGLRLRVIALRRPEESVEQAALAELRAQVEYLPELTASTRRFSSRVAHAALLVAGRRRYLDGLADVVISPDYSRAVLARAAILAHRIVRLGSPPLYVHFAHKPGTVGRFAALMADVPYALSAHAKDIWLTPPDELAAKLKGAATVLTCTDEGRAYLAELAGGSTSVRLVYHGVDTSRPRPRAPAGEVPVVLSVGRLVEKKGHVTLLRAAALLRDRGVRFAMRLAGEGPEWPVLQRLVHELDLADQVVFLGPLTESEVSDEYARAEVFALACRRLPDGDRDGLPNVVLEAMAQGLTVVSTTLAGVSEAVVDGDCGLLVTPGDASELADALERALTDSDLRARLGQAAQRRARERFDRAANTPAVYAALAASGLLPRIQERPRGAAGNNRMAAAV